MGTKGTRAQCSTKGKRRCFIFKQLKRESELFKIMKEMEDAMEKNMLQ